MYIILPRYCGSIANFELSRHSRKNRTPSCGSRSCVNAGGYSPVTGFDNAGNTVRTRDVDGTKLNSGNMRNIQEYVRIT